MHFSPRLLDGFMNFRMLRIAESIVYFKKCSPQHYNVYFNDTATKTTMFTSKNARLKKVPFNFSGCCLRLLWRTLVWSDWILSQLTIIVVFSFCFETLFLECRIQHLMCACSKGLRFRFGQVWACGTLQLCFLMDTVTRRDKPHSATLQAVCSMSTSCLGLLRPVSTVLPDLWIHKWSGASENLTITFAFWFDIWTKLFVLWAQLLNSNQRTVHLTQMDYTLVNKGLARSCEDNEMAVSV